MSQEPSQLATSIRSSSWKASPLKNLSILPANSWVQPHKDNNKKRIFFANKEKLITDSYEGTLIMCFQCSLVKDFSSNVNHVLFIKFVHVISTLLFFFS